MVTTVCYGIEEKWKNREDAIAKFLDCMRNSEGAERDRYVNIYLKLLDGLDSCADEDYF